MLPEFFLLNSISITICKELFIELHPPKVAFLYMGHGDKNNYVKKSRRSLGGGWPWCLKSTTHSEIRTLTRTLWGDQCLDAVACEGSSFILGRLGCCAWKDPRAFFDRLRNAVAWQDSTSRLIEPLIKYPLANQSA